jgi:hypothetical protein
MLAIMCGTGRPAVVGLPSGKRPEAEDRFHSNHPGPSDLLFGRVRLEAALPNSEAYGRRLAHCGSSCLTEERVGPKLIESVAALTV